MRKLGMVLMAALMFVSFAYAKNVYDYYNEGIENYRVDEYEKALKLFKKSIEAKTNYAKAYNMSGLCNVALKKVDHAIFFYKKAVHTDPEYAEAYFNMGVAYEEKYARGEESGEEDGKDEDSEDNEKNKELAVKNYLKAIELDNDDHIFVRASLNLARIYRPLEMYDEAVAVLREGMKKNLIDEVLMAKLYNEAGLVYLASTPIVQDDAAFRYAIKFFVTALYYNQQYVEAATNLGVAYVRKGLLARGIDQFEKALKIDPEFYGLHYEYANALLLHGFHEKAESHFLAATMLKPDFAEAFYGLGKARAKLNKFEEAENALKKSLEIKEDYRLAMNYLLDVRSLRESFRDHIKFPPKKTGDEFEDDYEDYDEYAEEGEEDRKDEKEKFVEDVEPLRLSELFPEETEEDEYGEY
ncbi:MAG: tetratricopeptide repeat protein [Candidatus Goldiibacteriota bacterium]